VWVLELSSFQLDGVVDFEPTAATVLNITQDHLDWHGDMQAYAAAKARIFGRAGLMVLNRDEPAVMAMLPEPVRVKLQKASAARAHHLWRRHAPAPGRLRHEMVSGMAWLVRALEPTKPASAARSEEPELHIQRLMPADACAFAGATTPSTPWQPWRWPVRRVALSPMLYGLREYRGEPHRVEPIGVVAGVEYFDDSKGTNVGATVAALSGLGADRRLVVILGGEGKGQDFSPLAAPVARSARAVVLMGRDAPLIRAALQGAACCAGRCADAAARRAVGRAARARPGDAVLMSPACASFDMFRDYAHRAQVFCDAVRELAHDAGQELEGMQ
jgi:UDP-N-acetylmuramoylalanine--D-glutamate ligase